MKGTMLILGLLFIGCNSNTDYSSIKQNTSEITDSSFNVDSLKRYSYLIVGRKDGKSITCGTGFLVKRNNKIFVISACHVFTCNDVFTKKRMEPVWDSISIRFNIKNSIYGTYFPVRIKEIRDSIKPLYFYEKPDVFVYELKKLPDSLEVNSIENLIDINLLKNTTSNICLSYGFPLNTNIWQTKIVNLNSIQPELYKGAIVNDPNKLITFNDTIIDKFTLLSSPLTYGGASGSPVYFVIQKLFNGRKLKSIIFGGVMYGSDSISNRAFIIRPEIVIGEINKK
jgi:hypothetical protein